MDMHSGTFNPQDFAWQGLTLTPAAADTHPRTGGKAAWYDRRALRR